jgi:glutathione S-transferase
MTITLYQHPLSGHSHRVRLLLSLLGKDANIIDVDLVAGAHKNAEFLAKNSLGQVPVIEDGETTLSDSNGILVYLASEYDKTENWYPQTPIARAEVQRFLSIAAGQVANGPAAARLVNVFGAKIDHERAKVIAGGILLALDQHLNGRQWLVGAHPTIADVANYAYIAHAPEGDVSLEAYPSIRAWLARISDLPGFVPMVKTEVGLAA